MRSSTLEGAVVLLGAQEGFREGGWGRVPQAHRPRGHDGVFMVLMVQSGSKLMGAECLAAKGLRPM